MTEERFNDLLNGPLSHPLMPFRVSRLALALRMVVEACGEKGSEALERVCRQREDQDRRNGEEN